MTRVGPSTVGGVVIGFWRCAKCQTFMGDAHKAACPFAHQGGAP